MKNLIEIDHISKSYLKVGENFKGGRQQVLREVSFAIEEGRCVGLIGESGSGKSTLGRLILGLEQPDSGSGGIFIEGMPVKRWRAKNPGAMSVVFQDYTTSVDPQYTVAQAVAEPLRALGRRRNIQQEVAALLKRVELSPALEDRFPHELSGGQLQRVCIARAIATRPRFILLDEAISALDVSVQSQIMTLLHSLRVEMGLTYLFIAHDLQAVAHLCNKMVFLHKGQVQEICESGALAQVKSDYARQLLDAVIPFEI